MSKALDVIAVVVVIFTMALMSFVLIVKPHRTCMEAHIYTDRDGWQRMQCDKETW